MDYLHELTSCELCEHRCKVDRLAGEKGVCRVLIPEVASRTLHPAPPESYTIFMSGCNFKCLNCQNWSISQYPDNGMRIDGYVAPERLAAEAIRMIRSLAGKAMGADRIFFSGGESTIHLPYIEKVVAEARKLDPSCKVNFDTNGFMTEASLERVLDLTTSITFDIKAYYDETHRALTGSPVDPVLRNAETVARRAPEKLWEYRILVIPGVNEEDIEFLCRFLANISENLPVCFLAFRPNYILDDHPGASRTLMMRCIELASKARLRNATWSGVTDLPGRIRSVGGTPESSYNRAGARVAAAYAQEQRCETHPRNCSSCPTNDNCTLKRYIPRTCY
ncbi:MAG: radical SAM protein [Candidatus Latescibacteria bacterium]|nr:radical SAM protein [Candidatus Latescibacterota bacterium]NIO56194.1 radical SAM protein [Candidatus Latescibacterota bacterium]